MRILIVGAGDPPPTFVARQIAALEREGIDIVTFSGFRNRSLALRLCKRGYTLQIPDSLRKLISAADVIHYQWVGHYLHYRALADNFGKPAVLSLRGRQINVLPHLPDSASYVEALNKNLPDCTAYHCVSAAIMEEAGKYGVRRDHAWVIRPAVDTSFFTPAPRPHASAFRIVMVGALVWLKAYEDALVALRMLVDAGVNARLSIAGTGDGLEHLLYTVGDLHLESRVHVLGRQTPEQIRTLLLQSDALLHTSVSEGIANVALEAMATGLPVVAADSGGMSEAIQNGNEGFIIPPRDPASAAERLARLANNFELRERLGGAARTRVVAEFDLARQGRLFAELYRTVTAA